MIIGYMIFVVWARWGNRRGATRLRAMADHEQVVRSSGLKPEHPESACDVQPDPAVSSSDPFPENPECPCDVQRSGVVILSLRTLGARVTCNRTQRV